MKSVQADTFSADVQLKPLHRTTLFLVPPLAALGPWASLTPGAEQSPYFFRILLVLALIPSIRGVAQGFHDMPAPVRRALWAIVALLVWGLLGLSWTPDPALGLRNLASITLGLASVIVMLGLTRGNPRAVASLRWGFLAAVVTTGLVGIWEIRTGAHLREFDDGAYAFSATSIAATFINPNNYGGFLLGTLGPTIIVLTRLRSLVMQGMIGLLLCMTFLLAVNTESRGAVIGCLIIILIAVVALAAFDLGYFVTAGLLLMPLALSVPVFFSRQMDTLISSITTQGDASSDNLRVTLVQHALRYFVESKGIGTGPGSFLGVLELDPERTTTKITPAHNTFAQVAAEYGLIGVVVLALILLACFGAAFPPSQVAQRRFIQFEVVLCFAALVGAALIASSVLGDPSWWVLIGYMLCLAWTFTTTRSESPAPVEVSSKSAPLPRRTR